MTTQQTAARFAILAAIAESMFEKNPDTLEPPPDPQLSAMGYAILAYVTAIDQLLDFGRQRIYYGFLAATTDMRALVFRGTEKAIEWAKDAEGLQIAHPIAGKVHAGFWNIYDSARLMIDGAQQPLVAAVLELAKDEPIVYAGHSLGSPLATFAAYDTAVMHPDQVSANLVASPRPGDGVFTAAASKILANHATYAYAPDLVPKVPFGFGYSQMANFIELPKHPGIPDNPLSNHHALNYAWLLDPASVPGGPI